MPISPVNNTLLSASEIELFFCQIMTTDAVFNMTVNANIIKCKKGQ